VGNPKKKKRRNLLKKYHKWPSIVLALFIVIFAVSGIVMNHRSLFSGIDVSRKYLPEEFKYTNWNNAAVKSACKLSSDSILVYGNIGIWLTDTLFSEFTDFNKGFKYGIDNRKIFKVLKTENGNLYAGTLFGLFRYSFQSKSWQKIEIPVHDKRVVELINVDGSLLVLTRSFLLSSPDLPENLIFTKRTLPSPSNYDNKVGLFKTLWVVHSGEIAGFAGKLFVDLMGFIVIILTVTGIIYWLFPKWIKKRKGKQKKRDVLNSVNRFSIKWHNKIGIWVVAFLIVTSLTGMFLRPPLLIAIANSKVGKLPFTILDSPNPWYDKLRRILFDEVNDKFIFGTNEGIYSVDKDLSLLSEPMLAQLPLSVMGINVFEKKENGNIMVGSFNGLYMWNIDNGTFFNYIDPRANVVVDPSGPPFSENMTAGYIKLKNNAEYIFDYNKGVLSKYGFYPFPQMPASIIESSPMSLWNLALEFHTGRFYKLFLGDFYILFIPLSGCSILLILITGIVLWWRKRKKANR